MVILINGVRTAIGVRTTIGARTAIGARTGRHCRNDSHIYNTHTSALHRNQPDPPRGNRVLSVACANSCISDSLSRATGMQRYPLHRNFNKSVEDWVTALELKPLSFLNNLTHPNVFNGHNHQQAVEILIKRKLDEGESVMTTRVVVNSVMREIDADDKEGYVLKRFKSGPKGMTELVRVPLSCCDD
jgi:hypothetical protein